MRFALHDLTRDLVENEAHESAIQAICELKGADLGHDVLATADRQGYIRVWSASKQHAAANVARDRLYTRRLQQRAVLHRPPDCVELQKVSARRSAPTPFICLFSATTTSKFGM